jgi:hypothetical protein
MNMQMEMFTATPWGFQARSPAPGQGQHANSKLSYHEPGAEKARSNRLAKVLGFLRDHGPATDRQVADGLGFPDMNAVRPRITEGITAGFIRECGVTECPKTGKRVRRVEAI